MLRQGDLVPLGASPNGVFGGTCATVPSKNVG